MVNRDIKTADAFSVYGCRLEETVGGNHRLPWYDCVRRYPEYGFVKNSGSFFSLAEVQPEITWEEGL